MILVTMSPKEIYDTISNDYRKLEIRIDKYLPKAISVLKKARAFPVWYIDDYVIPSSRNKYITYYFASNPSEITKPRYLIFSVASDGDQRYVIRALEMAYKPTPDSKPIMLPQVHFYTSHFLHRYNERFLHKNNITANEIAGLFFITNRKPFIIELNDEIKKDFKEYGEFNTHGIKADGGFCFARTAIQNNKANDDKEETMLIIYTTFVSNNEMSTTQKDAIEMVCNETLRRCMGEIPEEYKSLFSSF